jgi:putative tricarboxylic transport membrane protein
MFIGFGAAAIVIGRHYPMGSAMRMGPGYFPLILGGLLALLGAAVLVRSLAGTAVAPPSFSFKPLALILASVAAFALTVERLGIIGAVVLVVLISALASERFRWQEVLPLALIMVALAVGLFTKGLGLPFPLTPF